MEPLLSAAVFALIALFLLVIANFLISGWPRTPLLWLGLGATVAAVGFALVAVFS